LPAVDDVRSGGHGPKSVSDFTIGHIGGIVGHQVMYATRVQRWKPSEPVLWPHQHAKLSQLAAGARFSGAWSKAIWSQGS